MLNYNQYTIIKKTFSLKFLFFPISQFLNQGIASLKHNSSLEQ